MTVVVAIACKDGVVIAADSASTDTQSGIKQQTIKIKKIDNLQVIYGGSGDGGLLQKIDERLAECKSSQSMNKLRWNLKNSVIPEQRKAIDGFVPYPNRRPPPPAILLFAGVLDGKPWILEIDENGTDTLYDEAYYNFTAIGSGKLLVQALIRTYLTMERDLTLGKILAYRVIEDAIDLSAVFHIAKSIQVWTVSLDGTIDELGAGDIRGLEDTCESWRELQRETLGKLAPRVSDSDVKEPEFPKPEEGV